MTMEELMQRLGIDRLTLEEYIARNWIKPAGTGATWKFEEIDLARTQLVRQLKEDMQIGDNAMDVVLHLLDQLYGMHERLRRLRHALARQPRSVQMELWTLLTEDADNDFTDAY